MGTQSAPMAQLGRYLIRGVLGEGAMGQVLLAWDPKLQREVAIKWVARGLDASPKAVSRFAREAQAIAAIRHPNVVQIHDYSGLDEGELYLVMERLLGQDLFEAMHLSGPMPEAIVAAIGHELCLALEAAHGVGIIHRDLKPENVFLSADGRVVLTDFGIVKAAGADAAIAGYRDKTEVIGTPGFMSPEHMRGRAPSPAIDLFALGALMYNLATLQMPYPGSSPAAMDEAARAGAMTDPRVHAPTLSPALCAIMHHCLSRDPRRRPRTAAFLRTALAGVLEDLGVADVRADLLAFVQSPADYAQMARRREVAHLAAGLKLAAHDDDVLSAARLRRRLATLEPQHPALALTNERAPMAGGWSVQAHAWASSGLHRLVPDALAVQATTRRWPALAALVAMVALALGGGLLQLQRPATRPALAATRQASPRRAFAPAPRAPAIPSPAEAAQVEVEVAADGDEAMVTLDGMPLMGAAHRSGPLRPGAHTLVIVAGAQALHRQLALVAGEHLSLVADVSQHLLMVR